MCEADLYAPIRQMLTLQGFDTVRGEVKGCDIAALRGDELWVVEMKLHFNTKLLFQAMARQSLTPHVFVAIPRPKRQRGDFRAAQKLLKKLEIGLIVVSIDSPVPLAEILFFPGDPAVRRNHAKAAAVQKELGARQTDTQGGSRGLVNTAYRERAIRLACLLERHDTLAPRVLVRVHGCEADTQNVLSRNYYGWFQRVAKGQYALSEEGRAFLANTENELVQYYKNQLSDNGV